MSLQPPDRPGRLDAVLAEAWALIVDGAGDPASAFHWPGLATIGCDGRPRVRTVVLRAACPATRRLIVYTDSRSDKIAEIGREPRVALHAYGAQSLIQLRLEGVAAVTTAGPEVDAAWAGLRTTSRLSYGTTPKPGETVPSQDAYDRPEEQLAGDGGRSNFALVEITIAALEYLHLDPAGHRRARFTWTHDGLTSRWLVP